MIFTLLTIAKIFSQMVNGKSERKKGRIHISELAVYLSELALFTGALQPVSGGIKG